MSKSINANIENLSLQEQSSSSQMTQQAGNGDTDQSSSSQQQQQPPSDRSTEASGSSSGNNGTNESEEQMYQAERVIGNGSFGVVYQATVQSTGDTVAIKKVLQDRRYRNRELQIVRMMNHPSVVSVKDCFYSRGERRNDVYLNLVMEYIPETIYKTIKNHARAKSYIGLFYVKVYMYQMCRSLAYIHSLGICHRDIKPQNLLLEPNAHIVKLCDFGSAKILVRGEPNVAYICSRYYRAPELIFEATDYTVAIDVWSLGCVFAELLVGKPLFQGNSGVDQLVEMIRVLGTPSREQILAMNRSYTQFNFPQVESYPWERLLRHKPSATPEAIDLIDKMLQYEPNVRISAFEALAHPFFDDLREASTTLPNGKPLPPLFNFTNEEIAKAKKLGIYEKLLPKQPNTTPSTTNTDTSTNTTPTSANTSTASTADQPSSQDNSASP